MRIVNDYSGSHEQDRLYAPQISQIVHSFILGMSVENCFENHDVVSFTARRRTVITGNGAARRALETSRRAVLAALLMPGSYQNLSQLRCSRD